MPATIFSGSKVKALKDRFSLNDVTEIISVSADPTSGGGISAPLGSIAMDYLAGKVYKKTGSLATEWQELGAGLGGINYIENPDAESGTAGWSTYADAAGSQPVDGTGGSPNITWSRSTTTPLRGVADFALVKDGVNRQGEGVSYDLTIDSADKAKVLTVSFDYEVLSGSYATGDLAVYIIQDPAGTPVVIQPAGYQIQAATVGTTVKHIATFQTASNVTSYRLCVHVASVSTATYSLALDNISVGPQVVQYGAPVTDKQAFTMVVTGTTTNPTFGTQVVNTATWRRVGDCMEISWQYRQSTAGTAGSGSYLFALPSGYAIDTSKLNVTGVAPSILLAQTVVGAAGVAGSGNQFTGYVAAYDSTRLYMSVGNDTVNPTQFGSSTSQNFSTAAFYLSFTAVVPILGWSSTVQMSNDTDTRVVACAYQKTSNQAVTANVTDITFTASQFDTHAAWNGSAFVAPIPGFYSITGLVGVTTATGTNFMAFVDGTARTILGTNNATGTDNASLSAVVFLNAGNSLTIRSTVSLTIFGTAGAATSSFQIHRLSGPSAIAASETVAARFSTAALQALTTTPAIINFATISYDTHGAVTTGASWKFTAPIAGKYRVTARLLTAVGTTGMRIDYTLFKNGVAQTVPVTATQQVAASLRVDGSGSDCIQLVAGDYIDLRGNCSTGSNSLAGDATFNFVVIERIGN